MKSARFLLVAFFIFSLLLTPSWGQTQFFSLPGSFGYALNSINQVFDVNAAGTIGIALRNDPINITPVLTTFDPATGQPLDSKNFGFGPLHVKLAQIPEGLRAVVLTSQGGPRNIFLFSVSSTGVITSVAQTQLTTSINDGGSRLVVSPSAKAGFVMVYAPTGTGKDLVSFSLLDGSILGRLPVGSTASLDVIAMVETPDGRRLLAFFNALSSVAIVDASDVSHAVLLGTASLPFNPNNTLLPSGVAFNRDGRYLFASNGAADLSAIDVNTRSVVGSIAGDFGTIEASQGVSGTQLAVYTQGITSSISLVDAGDPEHLAVVRQYTPAGLSWKTGMKFSKDGRSLYLVTNTTIAGFDLQTQESFLVPVPGSRQAQQILSPAYCAPERVVSALGIDAFFGSTNVARTVVGGIRSRDFDGDGKSDILWRDTAGDVSMWQMNGLTIGIKTLIGNVWPGWTIEGSGDFNGDGKADILWRSISGDVALWLMDGAAVCGSIVVGNMPLSAVVAGVADFDADAKADILWRTSSGNVVLWGMNGSSISTNTVIANVWTSWTIADIGDFNGDGKADILWRDSSGAVAIWLMDGTTVVSDSVIANIWTGWAITDTGDFNGDGKADILWRSTSGDVFIWLMDGTAVVSGTPIANVWTSWAIAGTRDFDGDARADILWRDTSGNVSIWLMNGTTISSVAMLGNVSDRTPQ